MTDRDELRERVEGLLAEFGDDAPTVVEYDVAADDPAPPADVEIPADADIVIRNEIHETGYSDT